LEIWRFGDLEIWRFGDLEILKRRVEELKIKPVLILKQNGDGDQKQELLQWQWKKLSEVRASLKLSTASLTKESLLTHG
jgi:hypothetical protein